MVKHSTPDFKLVSNYLKPRLEKILQQDLAAKQYTEEKSATISATVHKNCKEEIEKYVEGKGYMYTITVIILEKANTTRKSTTLVRPFDGIISVQYDGDEICGIIDVILVKV
eukprot:c5043_g2_i1.p1 GENE.c5043_g2_i1~~c5043_g2_i1.p1  ORF type:complete len:112 (+),score=40.33 c5043_g2_i1:50-385(+)